MAVETAELETSFSDDPFDMEMSGFVTADGHIFLAREAWTPMNSKIAGAEEHFSFLSGAIEEDAPGSLIHRAVFMERRTLSSLAVVVLLHATLACLFSLFARPAAETPRIIDAQLVLLPGGSEQPGGGAAKAGPEAGKVAKPAPPVAAPPPPAPVKPDPIKPHEPLKVAETFHPVQKIHKPVRKRPKKIVRVIDRQPERQEVQRESSSTVQSQNPGRSAAATGTGTGGGIGSGFGHAGSGNARGPGGSGPSDVAFGSANGPRFLHQVAPVYPPLARRLQMQGTVLLRVTIDTGGRPVKVEVLKKAGFGMDDAAVKAVQESTFVPARTGDGQPLTCRALLPIRFVLETS